jgi:predicted enzyme related to lactoylglutathione lyase
VNVSFVAGFGPIVADMGTAQAFYGDALGIALEGDASYLHTRNLEGVKHFGVWPLTEAAKSCFGATEWPADVPVPQAWIEFDVEDVEQATRELQDRGYQMLVAGRQEPWGQTVTRLLGPEGLLVGITYTPDLRDPRA